MPRKRYRPDEDIEEESEGPKDIDLDGLVKDHELVYHDHVRRDSRRPDGTTGPVWFATERPMTGADVLGYRIDGDSVYLVCGDGQRWHMAGDGNAYQLREE